MSLLGKFWNRLRGTRVEKKRARRLFFEPLEGRQLLAADLMITKVQTNPAAGDPVIAGQPLTYQVTVFNNGPDEATAVEVDDTTPTNTTFSDFFETSSFNFDTQSERPNVGEAGTAKGKNGFIPSGQSATFTLVVNVKSSAPAGSNITNDTATVTSQDDPDSSNDT